MGTTCAKARSSKRARTPRAVTGRRRRVWRRRPLPGRDSDRDDAATMLLQRAAAAEEDEQQARRDRGADACVGPVEAACRRGGDVGAAAGGERVGDQPVALDRPGAARGEGVGDEPVALNRGRVAAAGEGVVPRDTLARGGHSTAIQGYRFITDTLAPGGSGPVQGYRLITDTLAPGGGTNVSAPAAGGFDWADAGIGAAIAAGLLLVLLGSGRALQQHRRRVVAV